MPDVSIVVPAYNEGESIIGCLDRLLSAVTLPCEVMVVYDSPEDTTAPHVEAYAERDSRVRPTLNTYGRGPARAIRFGMEHAAAPVVVLTMADGSDDVHQIDELAALVQQGAAVAAASRYMKGGRQIGGPALKRSLSRAAGLSLCWLARVGTHDATNSFKAYSRDFIHEAGIESDAGFEVGIELVSKARRMGLKVAEIPTTWRDRTEGASNFHLTAWIPRYLRWYWNALDPRSRAEAPKVPADDR